MASTQAPDAPSDVASTDGVQISQFATMTDAPATTATESTHVQPKTDSMVDQSPAMTLEAPQKPIHSLILDTGPLIKNAVSISTIINSAEKIYTTPAIISEIRDAATRSRVETTLMPFLKIRTPSPASYDAVTVFSKKTGDHAVLSRQDLGILALAYEVHCERNGGSWGLREVPKGPLKRKPGEESIEEENDGITVEEQQDDVNIPTEESVQPEQQLEEAATETPEAEQLSKDIASQNTEQNTSAVTASQIEPIETTDSGELHFPQTSSSKRKARRRLQSARKDAQTSMESEALSTDQKIEPVPETAQETPATEAEPATKAEQEEVQPDVQQEISQPETTAREPSQEYSNTRNTITEDLPSRNLSNDTPPSPPQTDDSDSDGEWITPSNLTSRQAEDAILDTNARTSKPIQMDVATMTIDFAMQNVLLQMNLHLLSTNMQRIAHLSSKVLRCHACFNIVKQMDKQFCPRCGGNSLRRVSCSTNSRGEFKIHLAKSYQWNKRGDKYSIPKPIAGTANTKWSGIGGGKGGWGRDLILAEDQKEHVRALEEQKRASRASDLMDDDYLPGILTGDRGGRAGGRVKVKVGAGKNVNSKKRV